ncbi:MAG: argininosuccinate lyase [Thermomicrobiales bacterium]
MTDKNTQEFPHPEYARYILAPGFVHAQELLFPHMMAANEAQALMLAKTGILPAEQALSIVEALQTISDSGAHAFTYSPSLEDLFFAVEGRLIEMTGVETGGNHQIARSRNDLAAALCRLMIRDQLTSIMNDVQRLRTRFIDLVQTHMRTIMPGITHTQPAQPTTLAHYLMGVLGSLERDFDRLYLAWKRVNQSPLGVAAFTTTSFPIDRDLTADLLGFDGIVENGYDAVGANDHMLEAVQALQNMCGSLSRFVYDLLVWARLEVGIVRIDDAFIQISSIMPQKRNPVVLEHIRARVGYVYGDVATVTTMVHSAAFGDTNDVEDQIYVPIARAFAASESVLRLLDAVLETAMFDVELLSKRASEGNMTTTALADGLVRDHGLSFRSAHHIVSSLVSEGSSFTTADVCSMVRRVAVQEIDIEQIWIDHQLDPWAFIEARTLPGGPAPAAIQRSLAVSTTRLRLDADRLHAAQRRVSDAHVLRLELAGNLAVSH